MDFQSLNLPENTPRIIIWWCFFIFVVWYFYRYSPLKVKVGFFTTFSVITTLFFFIFIYFWIKNRPFFEPIRIAVYPFAIQNDNEEHKPIQWQSLALSEIPTNFLLQVNPEKIFPYQVDWIINCVNKDSLSLPSYILDFSKRIKLNYAVLGKLTSNAAQTRLQVQIFDVDNASEVYKQDIFIKSGEYLRFGTELSEIVLENVFQSRKQIKFRQNWYSQKQIKNYFMAKYLFWQKNIDEALRYAELSVREDSSSTTSLNLLAELYLTKAIEKQDHGENALVEFQSAKSVLLKALSIDKNESTAARLLAELYLANKKWNQAEAYLRDALKFSSWDPRIYTDLTRLHHTRYEALGFKNEKELLKRAIFINPCYFEARFALADYYNLKNRNDLAIKTIQEVLSINPTSVDGLMALGKYYMAQNDMLNILETFEKVIKLQPDNADVYYNLGIVYYYSTDYETAIRFFKRAIRLADHPNSHLYLAYIYELRGEMDKAIEHLRIRVRQQRNEDDRFAEEARKHLYEIMKQRGVIDSLSSNSSSQN